MAVLTIVLAPTQIDITADSRHSSTPSLHNAPLITSLGTLLNTILDWQIQNSFSLFTLNFSCICLMTYCTNHCFTFHDTKLQVIYLYLVSNSMFKDPFNHFHGMLKLLCMNATPWGQPYPCKLLIPLSISSPLECIPSLWYHCLDLLVTEFQYPLCLASQQSIRLQFTVLYRVYRLHQPASYYDLTTLLLQHHCPHSNANSRLSHFKLVSTDSTCEHTDHSMTL